MEKKEEAEAHLVSDDFSTHYTAFRRLKRRIFYFYTFALASARALRLTHRARARTKHFRDDDVDDDATRVTHQRRRVCFFCATRRVLVRACVRTSRSVIV